MAIRCGNKIHETRTMHDTIADVIACFATGPAHTCEFTQRYDDEPAMCRKPGRHGGSEIDEATLADELYAERAEVRHLEDAGFDAARFDEQMYGI